jgi:hypothetical protein
VFNGKTSQKFDPFKALDKRLWRIISGASYPGESCQADRAGVNIDIDFAEILWNFQVVWDFVANPDKGLGTGKY